MPGICAHRSARCGVVRTSTSLAGDDAARSGHVKVSHLRRDVGAEVPKEGARTRICGDLDRAADSPCLIAAWQATDAARRRLAGRAIERHCCVWIAWDASHNTVRHAARIGPWPRVAARVSSRRPARLTESPVEPWGLDKRLLHVGPSALWQRTPRLEPPLISRAAEREEVVFPQSVHGPDGPTHQRLRA